MTGPSVARLAACRAAYDEHAAEYARLLDPTLVGAAKRLAERSGAGPGDRVLDIATGTGAVARECARRGATVVAVDISAPMLAVARELTPDVDFRLADVHDLPFGDGEFDLVLCGLALSHFDEPVAALREIARVLSGGGCFSASTWGRGARIPSSAIVVDVLERHGAEEKGYELDEETWLDPKRGRGLLERAGFAGVAVTQERFTGCFADVEEALEWTLAWPCGSARAARIDVAARQAARADARRMLAHADLSWECVFNVYVARRQSA